MKITSADSKVIEKPLPKQRGNVSITNLQTLNAFLYVAEHGCKWRWLPKKFGNWHTIYTRTNRWVKQGVMDHVMLGLLERILRAGSVAQGKRLATEQRLWLRTNTKR